MKRAKISLIEKAAPFRKEGFKDECFKRGKLIREEKWLEFSDVDHEFIRENYNTKGIGDKAHEVLGPIGKVIHWPCMKGDGTTDLKPGSPCDKGRILLNAAEKKIKTIIGS